MQQRETDKATKHKKQKLANFANANKVAIYQLVIVGNVVSMSETTNKSTETKFYNKFVNSVGGLYLNAKQVFSAIPKACTLWNFPTVGGVMYIANM